MTDVGLSARHLTISTVGVVPGIRRLARESLPVNLAVSLHAANDTLRDTLVPLNRRYPLPALMEACRQYLTAKGRRLSFEWALIAGVNDRPSDAAELAALAQPLGAHVNVIPLNPTPGFPRRGTTAGWRPPFPRPAPGPRRQRHGSPQPGNRYRRRVRATRGPAGSIDHRYRKPAAKLIPMPSNRWVDRTQPQTLMMATVLMYVNAALDLLLSIGAFSVIGLLLIVGQVGAGWGIANEKKWGYWLGVALAVLLVVFTVLHLSFGSIVSLHLLCRPAGAAAAPAEPLLPPHLVSITQRAWPSLLVMTTTIDGIDGLKELVGEHLGYSEWHEVTQEQVNLFADATGDHQWIHVDVERAKAGPFGAPIAHGYLTLSLVPTLLPEIMAVRGTSLTINYGLNKLRFPAPVPVGSKVRAGATLAQLDEVTGGAQITLAVTFEVEGGTKPVCVAEVVFRYMA